MVSNSKWDWESVKNVLIEGKTYANELKKHLNPNKQQPSPRLEDCLVFIDTLITSYDNALALINDDACNNPSSNSVQDQDTMNNSSKKRKRSRMGEQMLVRSEKGCLVNDGYTWRKYGQKIILNATHPRAYYRCTHRHTQSCLATKQVQRADDDDPSIFQVSYVGEHTCVQGKMKNEFGSGRFELGPKEAGQFEEDDGTPSLASPIIADLKVESFSVGDNCFPLSDCVVGGSSAGRSSESDFGEMFYSPTRVGDFVFGDLDAHFLDSCW